MIDSTNPRILADNIRALSDKEIAEAAEIVALQGDVEALGSYSADETNTGMKLGNADIYRKVFSLDSLPNATTDTIPHGISGIDKVLSLYGVAQKTASYQGRMFPFSNLLLLQYDANNIYISSTVDRSEVPGIVVIEYTKASPSPNLAPAPDDTRSIEPEVREEDPIEEPVQEVKKTTRKKSTN